MKKKPKPSQKMRDDDYRPFVEFLEANGWCVVVMGPIQIVQPLGSFKFNYQLVVNFTGAKKGVATNEKETQA